MKEIFYRWVFIHNRSVDTNLHIKHWCDSLFEVISRTPSFTVETYRVFVETFGSKYIQRPLAIIQQGLPYNRMIFLVLLGMLSSFDMWLWVCCSLYDMNPLLRFHVNVFLPVVSLPPWLHLFLHQLSHFKYLFLDIVMWRLIFAAE